MVGGARAGKQFRGRSEGLNHVEDISELGEAGLPVGRSQTEWAKNWVGGRKWRHTARAFLL